MTRPWEVARNVALGASTAAGMLREDPLLLVVQASRRLPARVTSRMARVAARGARPGSVRAVAGAWLAGHRDRAAEQLTTARPRGSIGRRLLGELAVELDQPERVRGLRATTRARAAWRAGDLHTAVSGAEAAGATRLADRYTAELATLSPDFVLPVRRRRPAPRPAGPAALHLLTNSLPHTTSGYTLRSHAVLQAQAAAGIRVAAATRLGYPVTVGKPLARHTDVIDGISYHRLLAARFPAGAVARASRTVDLLRPVAARLRPSVVHTTTPYGNGQVARALATELGVPWVYEVRGLLEQTWVAGRPNAETRSRAVASERFALLRAQEAAVAASADHVITLSATMRDDLLARGVPAERVSVVPNAIDARLLSLDTAPADARRALGLPEAFWVGTVSSLVGYEGLDTLIDAVALLRARGLDARACLVGDGVARSELERRAVEAGVTDAVLLPGRVPRHEAVLWHQALDVFVVPRRDVEVCRRVTPLKPVEAMALARPVVASALPALAEVVSDGAGMLVAPEDPGALADALAHLSADQAAREELGRAGRDVAATRTWAGAGRTYRALYDELAGVAVR